MSEPSSEPEATELFDVVIVRFDSRAESAAERLQRVFGLPLMAAESLLTELPVAVRRGENRLRAEYFRRTLAAIGAEVEVVDGSGTAVEPQLVAAGAPSTRPSRAEPSAPRQDQAQRPASSLPPRGSTPEDMFGELDLAALRSVAANDGAVGDESAAFAATPEAGLPLPPRGGWGELERVPSSSPSPRPRARRQPLQGSLPPPADSPPVDPLSMSLPPEAPADQSLPPRRGSGESGRPSARRSKPASAPPMMGRWEPAPEGEGDAPIEPDARPLSLASPAPRAALPSPLPAARAPHGSPQQPTAGIAARAPGPSGRIPPVASAAVSGRASAERARGQVDLRSFWECVPEGAVFPWLGHGVFWILAIAAWTAAANLLSALAGVVPLAGVAVAFFANTSVLALCADFHRRSMWAIANADGPLDEGPDFDPGSILNGYLRSGVQLSLFLLVAQLPLLIWLVSEFLDGGLSATLEAFGSPLFWLLAFGPSLYWPAAVACASLNNRFSGVWLVQVGLRTIARAPLEYLAIVFVGGSAFVLPWLIGVIVGKLAGLPAAFFAASSGLPLAMSHGMMGALTGQLMRTRPDVFE